MMKQQESKKVLIYSRFTDWSSSSTIAGYSNFYRTNNMFMKSLWLISFLGAIGFCAYLSAESVIEYLEFNVNTEFRYLRESSMALPGITLCPCSSLRSKIGYEYALNYSRRYINSNITSFSQWTEYLDFNELVRHKSTALGGVPEPGFEYDLNYSQTILSCNFGTNNCTNVYPVYDTNYGNCFNFNTDPSDPYRINRVDYADGFRAYVYTGDYKGTSEYSFNIERGNGLRLMIFNQSVTFERNFIQLSPGFCHYIRLRKYVQNSLPDPYSSCQYDDSIDSEIYKRIKARNVTYTESLCINWCIQEQIVKECNCYYSWYLPVDDVTKKCKEYKDVQCADTNYYRISRNPDLLCADQCPSECSLVSYDYMYSFDSMPGAYDQYIYLRGLVNAVLPDIGENNITFDFVRQNVVCVYVYFESLEYSYSSETPSKTIVQLGNNIPQGD